MIDHLEADLAENNDLSVKTLLDEVKLHSELRDGITTIRQLQKNAELISRLLSGLFPALLSKNEIKAISIPYQGLIFNYSKRFDEILNAAGPDFAIKIRNFDDHQFYIFSCCLILNRFYGTSVDFTKPLFYDIPSSDGYIKHYRIIYNADFLEIVYLKEPPKLSDKEIKLLLNSYDRLDLWKEKFPKETWLMKGFAIMTLIDVTIENAVSLLKGDLLGNSDDPDLHSRMEAVFKSIFRIPEVKIGFTSYDELNGKFRNISLGQQIESFILLEKNDIEITKSFFQNAYNKYLNDNTYYTIADVDEFDRAYPDSSIGKNFKLLNVGSFILAPIIKNGALLAFFELASPRLNDFNSVNANRLETVMPFLADAVDRKVSEFKNRLRAVIQNNYTKLHPSVNWKFEQEAYNFIQITDSGRDYNLKEIKFQDVYPLYGQVDVQNSSITRNQSVQHDLENQVSHLLLIFNQASKMDLLSADEVILKRLRLLSDELSSGIKSGMEQEVQKWLDIAVHPQLLSLQSLNRALSISIKTYLLKSDRFTGEFYTKRRDYEKTLLLINNKVTAILDKRHEEIQRFFPHYYERFKTDGVEHNLYIGESIYPDHGFDQTVLQRIKLWQLLVTVEMEMEERNLKDSLPYHLGLTSLVLVYSTPINIRFRMDEQHFDLDGTDDIRYEVIKKRIDKAHIKGSESRITTKEKLTIVYAKDEEQKEYYRYIHVLQNLKVLDNDVEHFELEDLQGVAGLRALRVGIIFKADLIGCFGPIYKSSFELLNQQDELTI
ncbi:GAF domain-containing protein [Mucilaginibacter sp.]|uniref:GAF domain-containing protein n=1 Tax=Mucilaginibacter sp. TaxID=1882438 RepID=UPI00356A602D